MLIVQALLVFSLFFIRGIYTEKVICNHNTPVCECMASDPDDECGFTLEIDMLQTFTRYEVDTPRLSTGEENIRGNAGRVWNYDANGDLKPLGRRTNNEVPDPCGSNIPIGDETCTDPFTVDGETFRSFIGVNGRIPGPTLIVNESQLVKVKVINRLASESISIHWHGMHQRNSNWMDGVEHVTQCGIPPGASFTYIFKAEPYGTHWYHSHSGAQRTDGLFGALIVKEKPEPMSMDETQTQTKIEKVLEKISIDQTNYEDNPKEHTLTLLDWQKSSSLDLFTQIHSGIRYFDIDEASELSDEAMSNQTYSSDGAEVGPVSYWSGLINGKGRHINVEYDETSAEKSKFDLSIFEVSNSKMYYRFRLIGAQSLFAYCFSIDGHKLRVIATDGEYVEPSKEYDFIIIHSGERYDFLLKTMSDTTTKKHFLIRAVTLEVNPKNNMMEEDNRAEAILTYNKDELSKADIKTTLMNSNNMNVRCTQDTSCIALNCPFKNFPSNYYTTCDHITDLKSLSPLDELRNVHTNPSDEFFFNFAFEGSRRTSAINARNLKLPSEALTLANSPPMTCGMEVAHHEKCNKAVNEKLPSDCYCTHVVEVNPSGNSNNYVRLVLSAIGKNTAVDQDTSNFLFAHPVHLHGHYFYVAEINFGDYYDDTDDDNDGKLKTANKNIECKDGPSCPDPEFKKGTITKQINAAAPLKDTLLIPAGGYAVVYFKSDNPGWWFLHCHIEVHQLEGMGLIINEGGDKKIPAPYTMQKCGNFKFTVEEYKKAINNEFNPTDPPEKKCDINCCKWWVIGSSLISPIATALIIGAVVFTCYVLYLFYRLWKDDENKKKTSPKKEEEGKKQKNTKGSKESINKEDK